jgi:pyruvate/2-oxoacid:ferredoxin oxidoreductase alpha subunit
MREALSGCEKVAILDRDISLGHGGVLWSETRGTVAPGCVVQGTMLGLGGGDIRPQHIEEVIEDLLGRTEAGAPVIKEVM